MPIVNREKFTGKSPEDERRERIARGIPARYMLSCNHPGLSFVTVINAEKLGYSYLDEYEYYMRSLEDVISGVLEEQVRKAIADLYFSEDDVEPMGFFNYYEIEEKVNSLIPYNEEVEVNLAATDKYGGLIETEIFNIMDMLDNDPDYFREYGVSDAVYQYISTALNRFEEESCWHFALKKVMPDSVLSTDEFYENVMRWPSPQKDGSWVDGDGTELQP